MTTPIQIQTHEVKFCPACGATLGRVVNVNEAPNPSEPGMLTVCVYCVAPLRYVEDIFLERVLLDELSKEEREATMRTQKIVWEGQVKR